MGLNDSVIQVLLSQSHPATPGENKYVGLKLKLDSCDSNSLGF